MSTYLGQNFLKDSSTINFIRDSIQKFYQESWAKTLVEIWPWKWAITRKIYQISTDFFVIEKDTKMEEHLNEIGLDREQIYFENILNVDIESFLTKSGWDAKETLVVGNLPYYITSPIFKSLFRKEDPKLLGWFFMIQNEVWEKIKSDASKKSYLWWLINRAYQVDYVKVVPAKCFSPAPKVKSCLVRCTKKAKIENIDMNALETFLNFFSPYSRKTLGRIAKMWEKKGISTYHIPEELQKKRLEELTRDELKKIIN